jgi:hypothetical protein
MLPDGTIMALNAYALAEDLNDDTKGRTYAELECVQSNPCVSL